MRSRPRLGDVLLGAFALLLVLAVIHHAEHVHSHGHRALHAQLHVHRPRA
jgi:hypothetical protein